MRRTMGLGCKPVGVPQGATLGAIQAVAAKSHGRRRIDANSASRSAAAVALGMVAVTCPSVAGRISQRAGSFSIISRARE